MGTPNPTTESVPAPVPARRPPSERIPVRIGRYAVQGEIGRGGMGRVYKAWDHQLQRHVAIKMLLETGELDEEDVARFVREARAAAKLRHPSIVAVHEAGTLDGLPYLAMAFVDGESFEALLQREPMPPRRIAEVVRDVCLGLEHAHAHGIVHRDLKPSNVLVDAADGLGMLTDFGLARDIDASRRGHLTSTGDVIGTPQYMSPEQALGRLDRQGPTTDVWGIGAILYRALGGRPPFDDPGGAVATIQQILLRDPELLRAIDPSIHPDLETIALRCLEKDRRRRYPSAAEAGAELDRWLRGEAIHARPPTRLERLSRTVRRNPLAVGAGVVVAIAIVIGVAFVAERTARHAAVATRDVERERRVDAERAAAAAAEARDAETTAAADATRRVIADALAGRLVERPDGYEDALFELVRHPHAVTVELLGAELDAISADLRTTVIETYRPAAQADAAEESAGEGAIDGLEAALDRFDRLAPDASLDRRDVATLAEAAARLQGRLARGRSSFDRIERVIAMRQEMRIGPNRALLARLCCHALGRLGLAEGRSSLARYLTAERHEHRAAVAAIALCRIGGDDAERAILAARERFGEGSFVVEVSPHLHRTRIGERLRDGTAESHVERGDLRRARSDWDGAIEDYDRALELAPSLAIALACRGRALLSRNEPGDFDRALIDLDGAIAIDPTLVMAITNRGTLHRRRGELDRAQVDLDRAIELAPTNAVAWNERGVVHQNRGDIARAIADADRAIELQPSLPEAWSNRGAAKMKRGDLDGALADFDRLLTMAPQFATGWLNRGIVRGQRSDYSGALSDLNRALELAPKSALVWRTRGTVHGLLNDVESSVADHDRALELSPDDAATLVERAKALGRAQRYDEAVADLDRAIELRPRFAHPWGVRGQIHFERGDDDAAIADLETFLRLAPRNAPARRAFASTLGMARQRKASRDR